MKRLITCTDGTWDKPGDTENGKPVDSNVCLLYNAIKERGDDGIRQLKVYETGVGSGYSFRDQLEGGVAGEGIDKKIKDVYTFLMLNYEPGDELYLFGFSRGAYTARSLAGFIRCCGILKPQNLHLLNEAFSLYRDRNAYTTPESDLMVSFRANYCFENVTRIKFTGVWDTVGALGIPVSWLTRYNAAKYQFHDVTLSSTIDYAYHALAVDERRKPFAPTLWQQSANTKHGTTTVLEQRWFAGVHCNVGGGYADHGLSNNTLKWMVEKAEPIGLAFDHEKFKCFEPNPIKGALGNSYTFGYWFLGKILREIGMMEIITTIFKNCTTTHTTQKLIDPSQVIDASVYERMEKNSGYRPGNVEAEL